MAHMKVLLQTLGPVALSLGIMCVLAIPTLAQEKGGKVTFEKNGIIIHPGTKLSKEDETALNDVLKKYDKRLYRVETYKDGKLTKTEGKLKDLFIDKATASEVAKARAAGVSDSTIVFYSGPNARVPTITRPTGPKPSGSVNSKELIEQLKPILQKYTKQ